MRRYFRFSINALLALTAVIAAYLGGYRSGHFEGHRAGYELGHEYGRARGFRDTSAHLAAISQLYHKLLRESPEFAAAHAKQFPPPVFISSSP